MYKLTTKDFVKIIEIMSDIVIENEVRFCEVDSAAGDGDFGMSLAKGFKMLKNEWSNIKKDEDIGTFLKDCSMVIIEHCGGASGAIWGSAFRGAAKYASGKDEINLKELSELLQASVDIIQKRGGAKLGDKTLLDALIPATDALKESAQSEEEMLMAMKKSANAAVLGAEKTKEYAASKGRASYVGERSISFVDAGAYAIGVIFSGIVEKFNN